MELKEIVSQLKSCAYTCEAGPLEGNTAFVELEMLATCEHENVTECLTDFVVNKYFSDKRRYEVYVCRDCGKFVNFHNGNEMTPDQIMQMFVDLRNVLSAPAEVIGSQATELLEKLDALIEKMPAKKP
jgi:hypothetical protein